MAGVEGGDGADTLDFVDVPARLDQTLAEERKAWAVAEQQQALRLRQADVLAGNFGARFAVHVGHPGAGWVETGEGTAVRVVGTDSDRRQHPCRQCPGVAADRLSRGRILE